MTNVQRLVHGSNVADKKYGHKVRSERKADIRNLSIKDAGL